MHLALEGSGSNPRCATQELCDIGTIDLSLRDLLQLSLGTLDWVAMPLSRVPS